MRLAGIRLAAARPSARTTVSHALRPWPAWSSRRGAARPRSRFVSTGIRAALLPLAGAALEAAPAAGPVALACVAATLPGVAAWPRRTRWARRTRSAAALAPLGSRTIRSRPRRSRRAATLTVSVELASAPAAGGAVAPLRARTISKPRLATAMGAAFGPGPIVSAGPIVAARPVAAGPV